MFSTPVCARDLSRPDNLQGIRIELRWETGANFVPHFLICLLPRRADRRAREHEPHGGCFMFTESTDRPSSLGLISDPPILLAQPFAVLPKLATRERPLSVNGGGPVCATSGRSNASIERIGKGS